MLKKLLIMFVMHSTVVYSMNHSLELSAKSLIKRINQKIKKTKKFYPKKRYHRKNDYKNDYNGYFNDKKFVLTDKHDATLYSQCKDVLFLAQQNGKNQQGENRTNHGRQENKQQNFHKNNNKEDKNKDTDETTYSEQFHRYFDTLPNSIQWTALTTMMGGTLYVFNDTVKNKLPRFEENCHKRIEKVAIPQWYELIRVAGSSMGINTDTIFFVKDKEAEKVFASLLVELYSNQSFMDMLKKHQEQEKDQDLQKEILQKLTHVLLPKISAEIPDKLKGTQFAHKLTQNYAQSLYQFVLTPTFLGLYSQFESLVRKDVEHIGTTVRDISSLFAGVGFGQFSLWLLSPALLDRMQKGKNIALIPTAKISMTSVALNLIMHSANIILERNPRTKLYQQVIALYPRMIKFYVDYLHTIDPLLAEFSGDESYARVLSLFFKDELIKTQGNLQEHYSNLLEEIQNKAFQDKTMVRRLAEIVGEQLK